MLSPTAADYVADHLTKESYYRVAHKQLFVAVQTLRHQGSEVDLVTLRQLLGAQVEEIGGAGYLTSLTDGVPRTANVAHYGAILEDLRAKRSLVTYATGVLEAVTSNGQSAKQLVIDADRKLLELQAGHANGRMARLCDSQQALLDNMEYRMAHKGQVTGVDTGFDSINELTLGWQAGDLVIVAARPSIGKTTFAMNSAVVAARTGKRVGVFSLEMRRQQIEYRILSSLSGVPLARLLAGCVLESDWAIIGEVLEVVRSLCIDIDDTTSRTAWDIRSACRRLKGDGGLDLVVVDYVQLMPGALDRRGVTRNEEVTDISRRMKELADELAVPILLLSQLNRGADGRSDPRPKLSDLRESGSLEQDADLVCFLHRKSHRDGGSTEFIIEKQRNGSTGAVMLTLDRDTTMFTDGGEPLAAPTSEEKKVERKVRQQSFFKQRAHSR
jgi:replicative DNA helicase